MEQKNKFVLAVIISAISCIIFPSCAKEVSEDVTVAEKRIIAAYLKVEQNDTWTIVNSDSVATFMLNTGSGKVVADTSYVFVNIATSDIKGNYLRGIVHSGMSTNSETLAKQLGEYTPIYYYGERLLALREDMVSLSRGLRAALTGKKEGDILKILIPSWASDFGIYSSTPQSSIPVIYEIEILKVIEDYDQYMLEYLQQYSDDYYVGIGPVKEKNEESGEEKEIEGLYVSTITAGTGDTLKVGDRISFNYIAKLLDGFLFETSIEDVAREYRVYNSSNTYGTVSEYQINSPEDTSSSDDGSSNTVTLPDGVKKALTYMKAGETADIFISYTMGFLNSSQSKQFGWWQPLLYRISIDPPTEE